VDDGYGALAERGFALIGGGLETSEEAFDAARALIDTHWAAHGVAPLSVIGDFVIPPVEGPQTRNFQTLHFDFGLPLDPKVEHDLARYTALYVARGAVDASAITRLVPLVALLSQRTWPAREELIRGLIAYGRTHGAWDDARGYVEGSLARVIEAAAAASPLLPSVKVDADFLCGMEFESLGSESAFLARHGLDVEDVQVEVALRPGDLLVFDNLALAHGRRGTRRPGELRQWVFGQTRVSPALQCQLRDRVLDAFGPIVDRATMALPSREEDVC
jgi:hypothetical protein